MKNIIISVITLSSILTSLSAQACAALGFDKSATSPVVVKVTGLKGVTTFYSYDGLGRVIQIKHQQVYLMKLIKTTCIGALFLLSVWFSIFFIAKPEAFRYLLAIVIFGEKDQADLAKCREVMAKVKPLLPPPHISRSPFFESMLPIYVESKTQGGILSFLSRSKFYIHYIEDADEQDKIINMIKIAAQVKSIKRITVFFYAEDQPTTNGSWNGRKSVGLIKK